MKTPREVLFERHRSVEPKLDAVRQNTLASRGAGRSADGHARASALEMKSRAWPSAPLSIASQNLREILLSLRRHLAGMSAVWLIALLLNVDHSPATATAATKRDTPSPQQLLSALRENRRQLAEMIEQPVRDPAPVPPRRSEFPSASATV